MLFGLTMLMVSIALVMAVIVTNIYLRKDSTKPVPHFIRRLFFIAPTFTSSSSYSYRRCPIHGTAGRTLPAVQPSTPGPRRRGSRHSTARSPARSRCPADLAADGRGPSLTDVQREEWQRLAHAIDRLFFWIFLAISVASLMVMYIRIPT